MADKKHSVQWFKPNRNYRDEDDPIDMGCITVDGDGSLTVSPDDDYYWGSIHKPHARKLAEAILAPLDRAESAGYQAYVDNPDDRRSAKERDLYPADHDALVAWDFGWARAELDAELGNDTKLYSAIGGASIQVILDMVRELKNRSKR